MVVSGLLNWAGPGWDWDGTGREGPGVVRAQQRALVRLLACCSVPLSFVVAKEALVRLPFFQHINISTALFPIKHSSSSRP